MLLTHRAIVVALAGLACFASPAVAQQFGPLQSSGAQFGNEVKQRVRVGAIVTAQGGPVQGIKATVTVPVDWPEQRVVVESEEFSPYVKNVSYRMIGGIVKQMVLDIPFIPAGEECRAVVTYEVTRHELLPPEDTERFVLPNARRLPRDIRVFLGPSPYIESTNNQIKSLAKEAIAGHETAWEKVEAIYDLARAKVKYQNGPLKGAVAALRDGTGDCEELTSLIVAMCRAVEIPARMVWVPEHCYAEFYLEDEQGEGHWFPCQAAGTRSFGGIPEQRPILQKGDNFTVPEKPRDKQRYVAEYLTGTGGKPKVKFLMEMVGN